MTVVEGWFSGKKYSEPPAKSSLPPNVADDIIKNICLNSKAFYIEETGKKTEFVGNRTECALLMLCQKDFGIPYDGVRKENESAVKNVRFLHVRLCYGRSILHLRYWNVGVCRCHAHTVGPVWLGYSKRLCFGFARWAQLRRAVPRACLVVRAHKQTCNWWLQVYGFSSARKMASCIVDKGDGTLRLYNKGASEWVLDISTHAHESDGSVVFMTAEKKAELTKVVTDMASRGLRTLVRSTARSVALEYVCKHAGLAEPSSAATLWPL